jgi:hypothetical protein
VEVGSRVRVGVGVDRGVGVRVDVGGAVAVMVGVATTTTTLSWPETDLVATSVPITTISRVMTKARIRSIADREERFGAGGVPIRISRLRF